ncbi:MAG TPA: hypothetical protein VHV57_11500 [Acidimicrobiales bacterium]|jgi:hypothetical protein|nr:hypothetical protein [Acidimicrobiales bacterium]
MGMDYVDAGYIAALVTVLVYGIGLGLRRRRWERAAKVADPATPVTPGGRS